MRRASTSIIEPRPGSGSRSTTDDRYRATLDRLSRQSVERRFDAYLDVPWDDPAFAIDRGDPRWELPADDPLGSTFWYRSLDPSVRAGLGLDVVASAMKTGLVFENVLKQGLLRFAAELPNGAQEFRYAYHEVIEEAQHSLMFQEFVNRSGFDVAGLTGVDRFAATVIARLGRTNPALFFVFVLAGEDPIDHVQRRALRSGRDLHPLLERIMRIHVTEEARHLSFARGYLRRHVPDLDRWRRAQLAIGAPLILSTMADLMLKPSPQLVVRYQIPTEVVFGAYTCNPAQRALVAESLDRVHQLCAELGLITPRRRRAWRRFGQDLEPEPAEQGSSAP